MTDAFLLAGRFGAAVRLSPKALRLYAGQGLLSPAHIDPATGYRYYTMSQMPRARLIARLRQLGLPLARIAEVIDLAPDARLAELRSWLTSEARRLAGQTELLVVLASQSAGSARPGLADMRLRAVAASKVVYRQRSLTVAELDGFQAQADADLRAHLRDSGLAAGAALRLTFHEMVGRDSEGLVEAAIAYEGSLEPKGDLRLRWSAEHREACLPAPDAYADFPLVLCVYDALESALAACADLIVIGSPCEVYPGSDGARFDIAYSVKS